MKRHAPYHYRELMNQLHTLKQWSMSMEEYRHKIELLIMKADIKEELKNTIDRFFNGLDQDIRNRVELLSYSDLNELVQLCVKVE